MIKNTLEFLFELWLAGSKLNLKYSHQFVQKLMSILT